MQETLFGFTLHWAGDGPRDREAVDDAGGDTSCDDTCVIAQGAVPMRLEAATKARGLWQADDAQALFHMPGLLRLQISWGRQVTYQLAPAADADDLQVFVWGAALPMLLHQRKARVVRGTAVQVHGTAIVLLGASGAGKSTVAAALLQEGATLVSDGWVVLDADESGAVRARPGPPTLRLFRDAAKALGWPIAGVRERRREAGGLLLEAPRAAAAAVPVTAFAVLDSQRGSGKVERQSPLQAVASLTSESPLLHLQPERRVTQVLRDLGAVAMRLPVAALTRGDLMPRDTARRICEALGA